MTVEVTVGSGLVLDIHQCSVRPSEACNWLEPDTRKYQANSARSGEREISERVKVLPHL